MNNLVFLLFLSISITCSAQKKVGSNEATLILDIKTKTPLNDDIFGHFLEKCNWGGETGADIIWDISQKQIRKNVKLLLDSLHIPIVRFPGGTDVDYYQWTELIDGAYDRESFNRPPYRGRSGNVISQNELGIDEFLKLSEQLNFKPLLVVNLGDAYFAKKTVVEAAEYAAAMVAYCNADVNSNLPQKYLRWAKLREKNGRREPYNVPYFQIGNEIWFYDKELDRDVSPIKKEVLDRYYGIIDLYCKEMKSIDQNIKIIIDGNSKGLIEPANQKPGKKFDMMAYHHYTPWNMDFALNSRGDTTNQLTPEKLYYAFISVPGFHQETGESDITHFVFRHLLENKIPIAITEWNWNGWVGGELKKAGHKDSKLAQGLGAASFLHAFMRHANNVVMGNQSMLAGNSWGINSIRFKAETDQAMLFPTAIVTGLYSRYHGDRVLKSKLVNNSFYNQEFSVGAIQPEPKVSYLDVVVTESDRELFIHVINRDFSDTRALNLRLDNMDVKENCKHIELTGDVYAENKPESAKIGLTSKLVMVHSKDQQLQVGPHSVNVFILTKK